MMCVWLVYRLMEDAFRQLKNKNEDRTKDNKKKKDYSSIICGESHSFKPDFYKTIIEQNGQVY